MDLQSFASTLVTPFNLDYVFHVHDMWANDTLGLSMESPNCVNHVESTNVVDPSIDLDAIVEPDPTLFVSFHNLFVVLVVEDFDAFGDSDSFHPDFEKVILLLHFEGIPPLLHFDVFFKFQFMDIDEDKLLNVNNGDQQLSEQPKMWAKNAFDEGQNFWGFHIKKSITNLSKDLDFFFHLHFLLLVGSFFLLFLLIVDVVDLHFFSL
jgi:hypothetical protein